MSDKTTSPSTPAAGQGDDRNLVPAAPSPAFVLEDKALEFGKRNQTILMGVIAVILLGVVGFQIMRSMRASKEAEISQAFGRATTIEAKRAFAAAHPDHALAGLALLAVADDSYTNSRFADAAREYATAAASLNEPLLNGRALIGAGVSQLKAGQVAEGEAQLRKVAEDTTTLMSHRSQAYYELASHYSAENDHAKARDTIDQLRALDPEGYWANVAAAMRSRIDTEESAAATEGAGFTVPPAPGSN